MSALGPADPYRIQVYCRACHATRLFAIDPTDADELIILCRQCGTPLKLKERHYDPARDAVRHHHRDREAPAGGGRD